MLLYIGLTVRAGGLRSGAATVWSEEYQALVYEKQLAMLARSPKLCGMTPWILSDFRSMLRPLAGVQDYHNRKGLVSETGEPKLAFEVVRRFYEGWGRAAEPPRPAAVP